jgi:hypothetical protein
MIAIMYLRCIILKKSVIARFLFILLNIMFYAGIIATVFLPKLYDIFSNNGATLFSNQTIFYQVAFFFCYILSLGIIYILIKILRDVYLETPFKKATEINLKVIAIFFMLLSIIITAKTIFIPTILSLAVIVATFIASLSFYVLSQVFKMANNYKNEVDTTI